MRLHKVRARLIERVLERSLVDGKEQVTLLDHLPVFEMQLVEVARNARTYLDRIYGGETTDIFVVIDDRTLDRLGNGNCRRGRTTTLLLPLATACDQSRKAEHRKLAHAKHQRK